MERSDIYELIRHAGQLGLKACAATCGYSINNDSIDKLKQAGVSALSFSLDGFGAATHDKFRGTDGAFDLTIKAAQITRQAGIRFQINTTITKINFEQVPAIAQLAKDIGADCFNPFILVPTGRGRQLAEQTLEPVEYEKLLNELLRLKQQARIGVRVTCGPQFARVCGAAGIKGHSDAPGCLGGREFAFISCRGDVQTCGFLDISAGNLVENDFDFAKIWQNSEFLKRIRNVSNYKGKCRDCEYLAVCRGCRARAYALNGDYLSSDAICNYQPEYRIIR